MLTNANTSWKGSLIDPSNVRTSKPRNIGVTVVIDKGLGTLAFRDLLETSADYIDFIKLGFGTSVLYPEEVLIEKIKLADQNNVQIFPGGTFFEVATMKGELDAYFKSIRSLGFHAVEISDGTIEMSRSYRDDCIHKALENNLVVLTEFGKKLSGSRVDIEQLKLTVHRDIEIGSSYVIVEGRESGKDVGIYDTNGEIDPSFIEKIQGSLKKESPKLIWETPQRKQQVELLQLLNPQVNLGNIAPEDIYSLESLRRGLRSDTFSFGL